MTKYLTLALALTLAACGGEEGDTTVIYMGGAATGGTTAETGGTTAETGGTTAETGGGGVATGGVATGGTSEVGGTSSSGGATTGGTNTTLPCDAAYLSLSQEEKCYQYAISVDPSLNPKNLETMAFSRSTTEACGTIKDQCGMFLNCGTCENNMGCGTGDFVIIVKNHLYDGLALKTPNICQGGCRAFDVSMSDVCDSTQYNWTIVCSQTNASVPNAENGTCVKSTKRSEVFFNTNNWCCNKP